MKDHNALHQLSTNLVLITTSIDAHSTHQDIIHAADKVLGQTAANIDIRIEDYEDDYPALDIIDTLARNISSGDGIVGDNYLQMWRMLAETIEGFKTILNENDDE